MNLLYYLAAFAVALGTLIVVHEYGHYLVARLSGVKVLRFSMGFGRPLVSRRWGKDATEWSIGVFPLGGYVKMLDEREGPVPSEELPRAFNRQHVAKRFAIVLAGPVANFLLAIFLYWCLYLYGMDELRAIVARPSAGSVAEQAGFRDGESIRAVDGISVSTWQDFRWQLLQKAFDKRVVSVETMDTQNHIEIRRVDLSAIDTRELERDPLGYLGLMPFRPHVPAVVGRVEPGSAADQAGMRIGDQVLAIDGQQIADFGDLARIVSAAAGRSLQLEIARDGTKLGFAVTPREVEDRGRRIGRIGVAPQEDVGLRERLFVRVHYGPVAALSRAAEQTWDTSVFSLAMVGKMLTGDVSLKNLSGPVTIADYAGQSARMGGTYYLRFMALISISLGVLNLLPIPLLDGGHLMYYLLEIVKGGPLSERVMEIGQQIGLAVLAMLMALAFYNDINRLVSG
ncbi:MAG: RIP metalloprotease RseP [Rhodocyclaceae bacterium]|nr:RIP metalloprotease RseP [Rhodocyclaceae bacterium]MBX3669418.1 RIP metalloprotease RseP [Rhodocyclaceae bacterium]